MEGCRKFSIFLSEIAVERPYSDEAMTPDSSTEFVTLLARHDRALTLYVYSLVPQTADADDILQQTKLILWKHFADFQIGTNFMAWARKTAFYQILAYRRKSKRDPLPLSDDMLDLVSEKVASLTDHDQTRQEALESCLHQLTADHRRLVLLRYQEDLEVDEIAQKISSTPGAVYRALSRLRLTLVDCVTNRLAHPAARSV